MIDDLIMVETVEEVTGVPTAMVKDDPDVKVELLPGNSKDDVVEDAREVMTNEGMETNRMDGKPSLGSRLVEDDDHV